MGRCPQLRLETRTRRWLNPSGRLIYLQLQLLKIGCRRSRVLVGMITSCLWLSPKSVKELTFFLRGLALFAVIWDQVLSSWLVIFRPATRSWRFREYLNNYLFEDLTSPGCWARRLRSFLLRLNIEDRTPGLLRNQLPRKSMLESIRAKWRRQHMWPAPKRIGWIGQTQSLWLSYPHALGIPWVLRLPCLVWWLLVVPLCAALSVFCLFVVCIIVLAFRSEKHP